MTDRTAPVHSVERPANSQAAQKAFPSAQPFPAETSVSYHRNFLHEELAGKTIVTRPCILRLAAAATELEIPEATLRDIRFYAEDRHAADGTAIPGNGFASAFLKLGRSVYVDIPVFVEIWRSQQLTSQGARRGR